MGIEGRGRRKMEQNSSKAEKWEGKLGNEEEKERCASRMGAEGGFKGRRTAPSWDR